MSVLQSLTVGIVVERREIDNPWEDFSWQPIGVIPGAAPQESDTDWQLLREGEGWKHFLIGTRDIELFRGETEGYRTNLANTPPHVYIVLSRGEEADEGDVVPFLVTVCPFEAESYTESGEDIVEGVYMPDEVAAWLQAFVDEHHVDVPFKKRKRKPYDPRKGDFNNQPRAGGNGKVRRDA